MNADHKSLVPHHDAAAEKTDLEKGLTKLAEKAKSGQIMSRNGWILVGGIVVLIAAIWYLSFTMAKSRAEAVKAWETLDSAATPADLEAYAKANPTTLQGRIARLQQARIALATDGVAKLSAVFPDERKKGIESIEKARDLLAPLIDEFKGDMSLQAEALDLSGHAELALVGIPKNLADTSSLDLTKVTEFRGSADKAAAHWETAAKIVGDTTAAGESFTKKAAAAKAGAKDAATLGWRIASGAYVPSIPGGPELKLPDGLTHPPFPPPAPPKMDIPAPKIEPPPPLSTKK